MIKRAILNEDPTSEVYLFGSRADHLKRGGDIDLLVFSNKISLTEKLRIQTQLFKQLEPQKIDIVVAQNRADVFVAHILKTAIPL